MSNIIEPLKLADSGPRIQSVGRVAAILDALLAAPRGVLQLNDLARTCGLAKTTTFTLVDSLVHVGLVDREERGGYRLGLRNVAYGRAVERQLDIGALARPALIRLCELTRETVNLAVPRPVDAFIVESFEGSPERSRVFLRRYVRFLSRKRPVAARCWHSNRPRYSTLSAGGDL